MGKSSIGAHIEREALCMIEVLRKSVGEPVDLNNSLNIAITNIVWAIVAGNLNLNFWRKTVHNYLLDI